MLRYLRFRRVTHGVTIAITAAAVLPAVAHANRTPRSGGAGLGASAVIDRSGHHYAGDAQHMGDRVLYEGLRGHDVRVLQDFLTIAGYRTRVTGYFGPGTKRGVIAFQSANHLTANGVFFYADSQKLRSLVAIKEGNGPVGRGTISHGLAVPPLNAPPVIREVIAAANKIAFKPYIFGGGHGSFNSSGYDCSGSVSYALHGGGLLSSPLDSSSFESYGKAGKGRWITIWTNAGHAYMYVAGLRFDTSAQSSTGGSRWTTESRSNAGFIDRHPRGW